MTLTLEQTASIIDWDLVAGRAISGAPAFWSERQAKAREVFEALSWPTEKDEPWRYSPIESVKLDKYDYSAPAKPASPQFKTMLERHQVSARIVLMNDHLIVADLDETLKKSGVYIADLRTTLKERPELLEKRFMTEAVTPQFSKFAALHGALVSQAVVIHVPRNVTVEKPLEVLNAVEGERVVVCPHLLFVAEENAEVSFINSYGVANDANTGLCVGAMELFVGANARVNFVTMNNWGDKMRHFEVQRHIAERGAQVKNLVMSLGGLYTRMNVEAVVNGEGVSSEMLGLCVATGRQHFDCRTFQDHKAPAAFSDVLYKNALLDRASTIFSGMIRVAEGAQKTDAYQTNRNMILSNDAQAFAMPGLEIQANDVKCSHGATVGQIEYEHLFYLMSRGIPKSEAEKLIVFGFFDEVLNRLPIPAIQDSIRDRIGEKVLGQEYAQAAAGRRLVQEGA
jgi:Fe-S cluster assembly protein SufD